MSAHPLWIVTCSIDGGPVDFEQVHESLTIARQNARAIGWKTGKGRQGPDFCPAHRPDRKPQDSSKGASS